MGSLFDELTRREAVVRQRIEEIGEQIAELNGLLEAEEDRLARLVIGSSVRERRLRSPETPGQTISRSSTPNAGPGPPRLTLLVQTYDGKGPA